MVKCRLDAIVLCLHGDAEVEYLTVNATMLLPSDAADLRSAS